MAMLCPEPVITAVQVRGRGKPTASNDRVYRFVPQGRVVANGENTES